MIRTGVGVDSLQHLREMFSNPARLDAKGRLWITTRNKPKQDEEILKSGGSLYWIIKQAIRARQKILGFEVDLDENERRFCRIILSPEIQPVQPYRHRHIQGWRYLKGEAVPPDIDAQTSEALTNMPRAVVAELRKIGVV